MIQKMFFLLASLTRYIPKYAKTIATMPKIIPVKPEKINPIIATTIAIIPNTSATVKSLAIVKTSFVI